MAFMRSVGDLIQRTLFTTTFGEICDHLEQVRKRLEELEKKLDTRVAGLEAQLKGTPEKSGASSSE